MADDLSRRSEKNAPGGAAAHGGRMRASSGTSGIAIRAVLIAALTLAGCGAPPSTPEEEIRAWIGAVTEAMEAGDAGLVADAVHPDYHDLRGNDRAALMRRLRFHLASAGTLLVVPQVQRVEVHGSDAATVGMTVRFAEADVARFSLDAGLRRVELDLVRDDDWRVMSARWSRGDATPR